MLLQDILQSKGTNVYKIDSGAKLCDAVQSMVGYNCGSLLVCQDDEVVGILTERDILRALADPSTALETTSVGERMNSRIVLGHPEDPIGKAMGAMTENRIRHLPIVQDGKTMGVVSMGDLVKAQHQQLARENHFLMSYIQS